MPNRAITPSSASLRPITDSEIRKKMELHLDAGGPELEGSELARWEELIRDKIRKHRPDGS